MGILREVITENFRPDDRDARRLFHGRGCCYTGLEQVAIDYFHPRVLITLFEARSEQWLRQVRDLLLQLLAPHGVDTIVVQHRYRKGTPLSVLCGDCPEKHLATERGLDFGLQFGSRQNIGFFLDMAEARKWLERRAPGKRVLNLFAFTCAFSVVARRAQAATVVNLDMSRGALVLGQQNHQRNRLHGGVSFLAHELFRSWKKLQRQGAFDLVIVDPPSRQPGSFVVEKDYPRLLAKLGSVCADGADVLLCLNTPHLGCADLRAWVAQHAPGFDYIARLPNPPEFRDRDPDQSLKVLHFCYRGS